MAMPVATVDENYSLPLPQDHVRATGQPGIVKAEAQIALMISDRFSVVTRSTMDEVFPQRS
jgi:hypothetical protein